MMTVRTEKGCNYGVRKCDEEYIKWGVKEESEQIDFAKKLLKLFPEKAKSILDVACGIGRYHKVWIEFVRILY